MFHHRSGGYLLGPFAVAGFLPSGLQNVLVLLLLFLTAISNVFLSRHAWPS
jgi:hypothetical protein